MLIGLFVVGGLAPAVMAQVPTPTAAGITDGFTLTTFATTNPGNTGCCGGPFGVAVASSGNIIVGTGSGSRYLFADTDGQTVGSALFTQTNSSFTQAYARAGGQAYGVDGQRHFVQFDPNGENELASQTLKRGVAAAPEDPSLLYHLAVVYGAQGHKQEEQATLRKALATNKPFPEMNDAKTRLAGNKGVREVEDGLNGARRSSGTCPLISFVTILPLRNKAPTSCSSFKSPTSAIFFLARCRSHRLPFDLPMEVQKAASRIGRRENAMHGNR